MPENTTHKFISDGIRKLVELFSPEVRKLMGEQGKTHSVMDSATKKPFWHTDKNGKMVFSALGPNHRKIGHGPLDISLLSLTGKANPIDAGLHILADKVWSDLKDIVFNRKKRK
jgi:hypothetical protein